MGQDANLSAQRGDLDRAGGGDPGHFEVGKIDMISAAYRLRRNTILSLILMGVLVGCVILGATFGARLLNEPPMRFLATKIVNPKLMPGEDLRFAVWASGDVDRNCIGSVTREFYRPITFDGVEQRLKKRSYGPAPIVHEGETRYIVDIPLPHNMEPGIWSFLGETTYDCGGGWFGGGTRRYRTAEMMFEVTARTDDTPASLLPVPPPGAK